MVSNPRPSTRYSGEHQRYYFIGACFIYMQGVLALLSSLRVSVHRRGAGGLTQPGLMQGLHASPPPSITLPPGPLLTSSIPTPPPKGKTATSARLGSGTS